MKKIKRKSKVDLREKILECFFNSTEKNISTNIIAKNIKSTFPTTKECLKSISDLTLFNKVIVDNHIVGYSLNLELINTLCLSDTFLESCVQSKYIKKLV